MSIYNKKKNRKEKNNDRSFFGFEEYSGDKDFFSKLIPEKAPKKQSVNSLNRTRLIVGFLFLASLMALLILRMGYLQIVKADELREKAVSMQKADTEIEAVRGNIYDSRMNTLAETVTEYELYGYTQYMYKSNSLTAEEKRATVKKLVKLTGEDEETILKRLKKKDNIVLLGEGLTKQAVDEAEKAWGGNIYIKTKISRYYPNGAFAAQLLGGVNGENTGRTGLEYEYNTELAGVNGRTVKTTDRQGNTVANGKNKFYQAQDGYSIVTSIDSVLQHYVEDAIESGMKKTGAESITAILMDPKTGNILAMAESPEYDPNNSYKPYGKKALSEFKKMNQKEQSEYLSKMWTVEAVSNLYEPGSTFKLITAASALENGASTMNTSYYCKGTINVDGVTLHCLGTHGTQDLKEAVGNSCNPALATAALNMGAVKFYNSIEMFGFRDRTNIDLPGETSSIVKNPVGLSNVDLATTGYGQGIAITPIQMLCAVCSFGNDGVLMQPKIVTEILDSNGKTVKKIKDKAIRQTVSEETAAQMCEIMEYYVAEAGGSKAYVPGYRVGGKTGTANISTTSGYSESTDCSFVAMAPMDDPRLAVLVIVHKPTKQQYGNITAGPIVNDILEKSLMYLGVEREYTESEAKAADKNKITVPNFVGMSSEDAIEIIKKKGLKYTIMPEGVKGDFKIVDQYPKADSKVEKKTMVYLYSE